MKAANHNPPKRPRNYYTPMVEKFFTSIAHLTPYEQVEAYANRCNSRVSMNVLIEEQDGSFATPVFWQWYNRTEIQLAFEQYFKKHHPNSLVGKTFIEQNAMRQASASTTGA